MPAASPTACTTGTAASTAGSDSSNSMSAALTGTGCQPFRLRCGSTANTRRSSSRSKPLMTETTTTRTAMLNASPQIATLPMNDSELPRAKA